MSINETKMQELTGAAKKEADEIRSIMRIPRSAHSRRCHEALNYRNKMKRQHKQNERRAKWDRCVEASHAYIYYIGTSHLRPEWTAWVDEFLLKSKSTVAFRGDDYMVVHVPKDAVEELVTTYKRFDEEYYGDHIRASHGMHGWYFVDENGEYIHEKGMR